MIRTLLGTRTIRFDQRRSHFMGLGQPSRRLRRIWLLAGVLGLGLTACGGGGGGPATSARPTAALPTLSTPAPRTSAPEPSASLPTLPTRSPTAAPPTTTPPPARTRTPVPTPTRAPVPTPTPTREPTPTQTAARAPAPAPAPTQAFTPTPSSTTASTSAASSSSPSPWVWWLIGLLVAAAVGVFVVLFVRGRRARNAWNAQLAGAVAESTWLAHELVPAALTTDSAAARRNVWLASRPRVEALERRLSAVVTSAPEDQVGSVGRLRDAVRDLGSAMDADAATDSGDRESLGAARQAQRQVEEALRVFQQPPAADDPRTVPNG